LDPTPNAPASVAADQVIGDFKDPEAVLEFAKYNVEVAVLSL